MENARMIVKILLAVVGTVFVAWSAWSVRTNGHTSQDSTPPLVIRTPDDFHVHLRFGWMLRLVLKYTASVFGRFLAMPNVPKIRTVGDVVRYFREILSLNRWSSQPLMTILIGPDTTPEMIETSHAAGAIAGKLLLDGVTTGADGGVQDFHARWLVFAKMEELGMALCLHAEMPGVFCLDREEAFLSLIGELLDEFSNLRIVVEHVTTRAAVTFVRKRAQAGSRIAATITAHHLVDTLDSVVGGLLKPHRFCKPLPKRPEDRDALIEAATSGEPWFFFGSDSAPHQRGKKECAEGCAGAFTALVALPTLAEVFERAGKLQRLEDFVSRFGAEFYGLALNKGTISLWKESWKVPRLIRSWFVWVVPWRAGETVTWKVKRGIPRQDQSRAWRRAS